MAYEVSCLVILKSRRGLEAMMSPSRSYDVSSRLGRFGPRSSSGYCIGLVIFCHNTDLHSDSKMEMQSLSTGSSSSENEILVYLEAVVAGKPK